MIAMYSTSPDFTVLGVTFLICVILFGLVGLLLWDREITAALILTGAIFGAACGGGLQIVAWVVT
jgi:hypothetical protein